MPLPVSAAQNLARDLVVNYQHTAVEKVPTTCGGTTPIELFECIQKVCEGRGGTRVSIEDLTPLNTTIATIAINTPGVPGNWLRWKTVSGLNVCESDQDQPPPGAPVTDTARKLVGAATVDEIFAQLLGRPSRSSEEDAALGAMALGLIALVARNPVLARGITALYATLLGIPPTSPVENILEYPDSGT